MLLVFGDGAWSSCKSLFPVAGLIFVGGTVYINGYFAKLGHQNSAAPVQKGPLKGTLIYRTYTSEETKEST